MSIPQLVSTNALQRPDSPAVVCRGDALTYLQLEQRSNQLANTLCKLGVERGDRVGIFMEKSLESAVSMYGIMRCGAAYVPLDPAAPVERLVTILRDCNIRCVTTQPAKRRTLNAIVASNTPLDVVVGIGADIVNGCRALSWDEVATASHDAGPWPNTVDSDLAYIIYTSGSTGIPKGIMHTHRSGLAFARWAKEEYEFGCDDRLSNHAPLHFDLSILDYFSAAMAGACTVIIPEEFTRLPASYSQLLEEEAVTVLYTVPFALIQLLARGVLEERDLSQLRWVIFGGEPYPAKHLRGLMNMLPDARFDNIYGPAEVNGCSHYTVPPNFSETDGLSIGPICSIAEDLIVDANDIEVPPGKIGELLVRTPTMMRGYWARPDLDEQAFFVRESNAGVNHVFYRTGDHVWKDDHGLMYFVGRKDRQVKVRGYRIELDEVESALTSLDGVEESAVFALPDIEGSKKLHAIALLSEGIEKTSGELVAELKKRVPHYAVPTELYCSTELPRTSTGKIDRNRLSMAAKNAEVG